MEKQIPNQSTTLEHKKKHCLTLVILLNAFTVSKLVHYAKSTDSTQVIKLHIVDFMTQLPINR